MKLAFLLTFTFVSNCVFSQTILDSTLVPSAGDTYLYHSADTNGAWTNANNQNNWDFNYLNIDDTLRHIYYLSATGTPYDTAFTNSNIVMTTDSIRYTYFNSTNSVFETIGTAAGNEVTHYVNTVTNYNLPFALNNNFTDLFYSSLYYSGVAPTIVTGSNNTFCNTTGNLSLGNIVYNNVYKVRANQTIIYDYYNGIYTTTQTVNRFSWYDGITKFPLLEYEHVKTVNNYDPIGTFHINAVIKVREGLLTNKIVVNQDKVNIINTENKIQINGNLKVLSIELLSLNGQIAKLANNTSVLETENIIPGIYLVKVVHVNGIEYKKINIQ